MGASLELICVPRISLSRNRGRAAGRSRRGHAEPSLIVCGIELLDFVVGDRAGSRGEDQVELGRRLGHGEVGRHRARKVGVQRSPQVGAA